MRAGEVLDGRFRIEREAGSGAMGVVFRAEDLHEGGSVAIKVLRSERAAPARFKREVRVLSQLRHPSIVRYVGHGKLASGGMYLAMEWLEGEDLAERLASGPLAVAEALELTRRVADALAVAHARGIVHRDLKPSNLFLPNDDPKAVKLLDFGIARLPNATSDMTLAGAVLGTPGYMAPEQARGDNMIDARADVFALGCVLFECLAGRPVFVGDNMIALLAKILMEEPPRPSELRPLSPAIDALVMRMLAKKPNERFADGREVERAVAKLEPAAALSEPAGEVRRSAVTRGEQVVVSVVIAAAPRVAVARPATEVVEDDEAPLPLTIDDLATARALENAGKEALAATVPADVRGALALDVLARFGARCERLADGAVVAILHGTGAATDQAAQAARSALEMRRLLPQVPLVLATGSAVFAGRIPIGPVIERAAQLARQAERTADAEAPAIHLDAVTAGLLPSRYRTRAGPLGMELTGDEYRADVPRTVLGRTTRFVGRDAEMGMLTGIHVQVESEAIARAVVVTAAPGLGKSRLREELLKWLRERDVVPAIWMGSAEPLGSGTPLGVVADVLRDAMDLVGAGADDRENLVKRVAERVPPENVARVATFLAELVGTPLDLEPALEHAEEQLRAARREPPLMAEQMERAFLDFVRAACAARPVVVVLEDAHWGDLPTMKLLDAALRELTDSALLVIAFGRPEIEDTFPGLFADRNATRIALGGLTPRAAERLARDVLGSAAHADTIRQLVTHAAGNPFFLEELLRASADGSVTTMPDTLLAMLQKRLEALDDEARRVLRAASVFGGVFWRGAVTALLGAAGEIDVGRRLNDLVEREVLVRLSESRLSNEPAFAFRHALVRDAAYQTLPDADRIVAHRFAAEWLEGSGEPRHALLAQHYERGGDRTRSAENYARAAAQALHADDLEGCLRLAKRGLDIADETSASRGSLHLTRADAYHWRAEFEQSRAESTEALHLLPRSSDEWFAASAIAVAACATLGHSDEALALSADLAKQASPERPASLVAAAQCAAFLPQGTTTETLLALLPKHPANAPDALLAARTEVAYAMRAQAKGDSVLVLEHVTLAAEHFERAGHSRGARAARANAAWASSELGEHEEAERHLRDVLADAERFGIMTTVAWTLRQLGTVVGRLDRTSEALSIERRAAQLARTQGNRRLETEVAVAMADIMNASGLPELAVEQAERALETADTPALRAAGLSALASGRLALGDAEAALVASTEAMAILAAGDGVEDVELPVRLAHATALRARGDHAAATEAIEVAERALASRAHALSRPERRQTFLDRVPINARILHLVSEWAKPSV